MWKLKDSNAARKRISEDTKDLTSEEVRSKIGYTYLEWNAPSKWKVKNIPKPKKVKSPD